MIMKRKPISNHTMIGSAMKEALKKLNPKTQVKNPVMFIVYVASIFTTGLFLYNIFTIGTGKDWFSLVVSAVLWFTVLSANFAEAVAENRGKTQADTLRKTKQDIMAKKISSPNNPQNYQEVPASILRKGDLVYVVAGDQIPADGQVLVGTATVDESAITGESAPVIREWGDDRSAVTGGTTITSDTLVIRVTMDPGNSFLDQMIGMVEGGARKKTPTELGLQILLTALTVSFLLVIIFIYTFTLQGAATNTISITALTVLLVCLTPTTIGGLLSSIGIAGMSRLNQANVFTANGQIVEAAGDVDTLMLDKTGTITMGNRRAEQFIPVDGVDARELADAAQISSLTDETPEGRSIVILAKKQFCIRSRNMNKLNATFIPFDPKTRMSGADCGEMKIRKGAADAIETYIEDMGGIYSAECDAVVRHVCQKGGTPLVVTKNDRVLGVIHLRDVIKQGVKENLADMRKMGIKTIMVTGDNPLTAAAIAAEAGVDDFLAEATPETKLTLIREYQRKGHLVAMAGDGTNDAPALAQADVAVAMNTGTQEAKAAGNMVDLDSSPTKLLDIVRIGKQLLMTRGALTTFSIANDIAKYIALIPILFGGVYPQLSPLNMMNLTSPESAMISTALYSALIIMALIPLALKGIKYREVPAKKLLTRNVLVYGLGGILVPFAAIKFIDLLITAVFLL